MGKEATVFEALRNVTSGATIMVGGFGLVGCPLALVDALEVLDLTDLTILSNNLGEPGRGLGRLLRQGRVKKTIGSFFTSNPDVVKAYQDGRLNVELIPQGTFVEAIRAGGAGLGGFFTPTSAGTRLAEGREMREINGTQHVFQPALRADVALIKGYVADVYGNLTYYKTARNFNPIMATAADLVVAEVDWIVEAGALSPEVIVTPHIYVDALVLSAPRDQATSAKGGITA